MSRLVLAAVVALVASACSGTVESSSAPTSAAPADACRRSTAVTTVAYRTPPPAGVDPDRVSLDVYPLPEGCSAPVVVWVHGGGYQVGDKARQIDDKVRLARREGWVLVSVNYRLTESGRADSAKYPDHFADVATALRWIETGIGRFGGDPRRLALLGHSAGADIVTNVVLGGHLQAAGADPALVDCMAPLDTAGFDKTVAGADEPDGEVNQWQEALGNKPDYLTTTSATSLVRAGAKAPPTFLVSRGSETRRGIVVAFADAVRASGTPVETVDLTGFTHGDVNRRIGDADDDRLTPALVRFVADCVR